MKTLTIEQQIILSLAYRETNISALARAIKMHRQTLHRKILNNTLKKEELVKIGKALGGRYLCCFYFPGGIIFGDKMPITTRRKFSNKGG